MKKEGFKLLSWSNLYWWRLTKFRYEWKIGTDTGGWIDQNRETGMNQSAWLWVKVWHSVGKSARNRSICPVRVGVPRLNGEQEWRFNWHHVHQVTGIPLTLASSVPLRNCAQLWSIINVTNLSLFLSVSITSQYWGLISMYIWPIEKVPLCKSVI